MMQFIRDHVQGIIIWIILGFLIITFAMWGVGNYFNQGSSNVNVASVNGTDISEQAFLNAYREQQERLQTMLGKNYRPELFDNARMKREVLDQLIDRELQSQLLHSGHYAVAPQLLARQIEGLQVFHDNGAFSKARYEQLLRRQGMSAAGFEAGMARDMMAQQMRDGIVNTAFVTPLELNAYQRLLNQQRDVGVLTLPLSGFLKTASVDDKAVKAYFDAHQDAFKTPEQVSVNYVELSMAEIAAKIPVSEEDMRQYYTEHQDKFVSQPEERRVRHILIKVDKDTSDAQALAKIEDLEKQLKAGASFAALAKKYSQDPGSAKQGGDLGFFARGVMDKAFEAAAFGLKKKGEISAPVRSQFGYHLLQLEDIRPGKEQTFEQAKAEIRHELQMQKADKPFYEAADQLSNLAYEHPDALDYVAKQLGLEIKHTGLFSRQGASSGIAKNPKVVSAAFSDEVLNQGMNSDALEVGTNDYVVLRVAQHKPAEPQPFEAVRARIEQQLREQAARAAAEKAAADARKRMVAGEDPMQIVKAYAGATWQRAGFIGRRPNSVSPDKKTKPEAQIAPQVREAAFALPRPSDKAPSFDNLTLPDGDGVVLAVYAIREAPADEQQVTAQMLERSLTQGLGSAEYAELMQDARSKAKIEISNKALTAAEQQ